MEKSVSFRTWGLVVFIMSVTFSAAFSADITTELSLDYWKPDWNYEVKDSYGNSTDYDATTSGMLGPRLKVSFQKFFVSASYLYGKFDLKEDDDTGTRQDMGLQIGYNLGRNFAVRVQYEDYRYEHALAPTLKRKQSQTGFGFGVSAFTIFGETRLYGYGSLAYSPFGKVKDELGTDSVDSNGSKLAFDAGIGYAFEIPVSVSVGYRYFKTTTSDDILDATFNGITASVSYRF